MDDRNEIARLRDTGRWVVILDTLAGPVLIDYMRTPEAAERVAATDDDHVILAPTA